MDTPEIPKTTLQPKPETRNIPPELREISAESHAYIKHIVKEVLHLRGIKVATGTEIRDSKYFDTRRTLGILGIDESTITLLTSSDRARLKYPADKVSTLIPLATEKGSGLLKSDATSTLWVDLFWVCEDGLIKLVKTDHPIPIDGLFTMYSSQKDFDNMERLLPANTSLFRVTDDKNLTKKILSEAGIMVPRGEFISAQDAENIDHVIDASADRFPNGFVVKGNNGGGGTFVKLFESEETVGAKQYAQSLIEIGQDVIVEERISPMPLKINRTYRGNVDLLRASIEAGESDYNIRTLVTLGDYPQIIDSEVRFSRPENKPVNIHQGAEAERTDTVLPEYINDYINAVALDATKALCDAAVTDKKDFMGFVGIDLMVNRSGQVFVIEANSGAVGGFGTLAKLDERPLQSVAAVLIPSTVNRLNANYHQRQDVNPDTLTRIPLSDWDEMAISTMAYAAKNISKSERILRHILEHSPDNNIALYNLGCHLGNLKLYQEALECFEKVLEKSPNDNLCISGKVQALAELKRFDEAEKVLESQFEKGNSNQSLLYQLVGLKIRQGDESYAYDMLKELSKNQGYSDGIASFEACRTIFDYYRSKGNKVRSAYWLGRISTTLGSKAIIGAAQLTGKGIIHAIRSAKKKVKNRKNYT